MQKNRILYTRLFYIPIVVGSLLYGCRKFIEVAPPTTQLTGSNVYDNNASASAVVTSIYDNMSLGGLATGQTSINLEVGLLSDELTNYYTGSTVLPQFYSNALTSTPNNYFWPEIYEELYIANSVLANLPAAVNVTAAEKKQLTGEAEFMRAFLNFYAVNLYGAVPLVITTNYKENNTIKRSPVTDVYQQIITDLKDAESLLSSGYLTPTGSATSERVRPNKAAAQALLARVYLYTKDWSDAENQADSVLANTAEYSLVRNPDSVFLKNSSETIWQLQPVTPGYNTFEGYYFVLTTTAPGVNSVNPVAMSNYLVNAFDSGDLRRADWVGAATIGGQTYYYPYKYKVNTYKVGNPVTEYSMVLRLAEVYLIRAEARAQQNNVSGAQADLNAIRGRAGLGNTTAANSADLLTAVLHERQVELFTEWGHRWFDLIRTGQVSAVMSVVTPAKQGGAWNSNMELLPIPQSEILINPNLTQNPGYQ
jgi:hypothetical protein